MWLFGAQPRGQGLVGVGVGVVVDAQGLPGSAVAALAHHGQAGGRGLGDPFDAGGEAHCVGQALLQRGHVHDPGEGLGAQLAGIEAQLPAIVAPDLHGAHRRHGAGHGVGPGAQGHQEVARGLVQGVGAHVVGARGGFGGRQGHAQAVLREQQGQRLAHHAGAADGHVGASGGG